MAKTDSWSQLPSKRQPEACPYCGGSGRGRQGASQLNSQVPHHQRGTSGFSVRTCPVCFGKGKLRSI